MSRTIGFVLGAALLIGGSVCADVTDGELACETSTAKAMGKQTASRSKCIVKCQIGARAGKNPITDCSPGSYQGDTASCVAAAEGKAAATEIAKCTACPACYDGDGACAPGDCACDAPDLAEEVAAAIDLYAGFTYCTDAVLTEAEAKCQDVTTKTLAKFVVKRLKCEQKCHAREHAGDVPAGSCHPATDPTTAACLATASTKAATTIDKVCEPVGGDRPECYATDGAGWASLIGSVVDGYDPQFFCGSPSAAFVD